MKEYTDLAELLTDLSEPLDPPNNGVWCRWWRFHQRHPEVYEYLLEKTRLLVTCGRRKYSMKALYNIARWHFEMERDEQEDYKLNDVYRSRYARLIMAEHEDLEGIFNLRQLRAE